MVLGILVLVLGMLVVSFYFIILIIRRKLWKKKEEKPKMRFVPASAVSRIMEVIKAMKKKEYIGMVEGIQIREYIAPDNSCSFLLAKLPNKGWTLISNIKERS